MIQTPEQLLAEWGGNSPIDPVVWGNKAAEMIRKLVAEQDVWREIAGKQASAIARDYTAVKKLHAAKGRYHTQLAACELFELHGLPCERPKK